MCLLLGGISTSFWWRFPWLLCSWSCPLHTPHTCHTGAWIRWCRHSPSGCTSLGHTLSCCRVGTLCHQWPGQAKKTLVQTATEICGFGSIWQNPVPYLSHQLTAVWSDWASLILMVKKQVKFSKRTKARTANLQFGLHLIEQTDHNSHLYQ